MNLKDLLHPLVTANIPAIAISGLQNDSRLVTQGDVFIAYPGAATDGRLYIDKAVAAGASAVVYEPQAYNKDLLPKDVPCFAIAGLLQKLPDLANIFYDFPARKLKITGVTGTNGKTTIAYQLAQAHHMLAEKSAYIGTIGEGEIGHLQPFGMTTPDALRLTALMAQYKQKNIKQVSMEVSSHALAQHRVDGLAFQQAIFTNLSHDHLDYHATMEDYIQAKARLFAFDSLEYALINRDDPYHERMSRVLPAKAKPLYYGLKEGADIRAVQWETGMMGSQMQVQSPWGKHNLKIKALGEFNLYNTLAVWGSLLACGYSPEAVLPIMAQLQAAPGRMEIVAESPCVVVDYAHTPDALEKALTTLKAIKKGHLWVVFGCGGDRDRTKRPIMGAIASKHADRVVITSDNPRCEQPESIMAAIAEGCDAHRISAQFVKRQEAILYALNRAEANDIILIAGKGHEAYQEIDKVQYPFSDQEVVRLAAGAI